LVNLLQGFISVGCFNRIFAATQAVVISGLGFCQLMKLDANVAEQVMGGQAFGMPGQKPVAELLSFLALTSLV